MSCLICSNNESDRHHVKTRGAGGTDDDFNLMNLCRIHHVEIHKIGNTRFAVKYYKAKHWLTDNGWAFNEVKMKWVRYEN